jgi:hypothetical protein
MIKTEVVPPGFFQNVKILKALSVSCEALRCFGKIDILRC